MAFLGRRRTSLHSLIVAYLSAVSFQEIKGKRTLY